MTQPETLLSVLEGSCVVISGDIDGVTGIIPHSRGLITPLITTQESPSVKATNINPANSPHGPKECLIPSPAAAAPRGGHVPWLDVQG